MKYRTRAKPNTPERYLWQKPGARHLWFRMAVPTRFRSVESRRIIQRSVGTTDRKAASVRAAKLRTNLHSEWEAKLTQQIGTVGWPVMPTERQMQREATEAAYLRIQSKTEALWKCKAGTVGAHEDFIRSLTEVRDWYIATRHGSTKPRWEALADKRILKNGWELPKGSSDYEDFVQMFAEAAIEVLRVEIERRTGNFGAEPTSTVVKSGLEAHSETVPAGETISELFERYAAQRLAEKRKRQDTVNQDRKIVHRFVAFVGSKKSIRSITGTEIRQWRDAIAVLPPGFATTKGYVGLSLTDAAARAQKLAARQMSPSTVNKYLSTVSPFIGWCVRNGYADQNPCDGLFYDLPKGSNPRPPFSSDQLRRIFSSPLFTGFEDDGREHLPGSKRANDWRYWIPLVCLFTGARISEIAQLRTDDLECEGEIPFINIRHDGSRGQATKSAQSRVTPLHPKLVKIGFVDFAQQRANAARNGSEYLFPELRPNERNLLGATPSRFWRDYLRRIGLKAQGDGLGSHSFRHLMTDQLRIAGYIDEEIKIALGHNQKSVTGGYGRVKQGTVSRLYEMISKVLFEEINL